MRFVDRLRWVCIERQLEISACHQKINALEAEAKREKRPVPRLELERLLGQLRDAKANLYSAEAAVMGAATYPPIAP